MWNLVAFTKVKTFNTQIKNGRICERLQLVYLVVYDRKKAKFANIPKPRGNNYVRIGGVVMVQRVYLYVYVTKAVEDALLACAWATSSLLQKIYDFIIFFKWVVLYS